TKDSRAPPRLAVNPGSGSAANRTLSASPVLKSPWERSWRAVVETKETVARRRGRRPRRRNAMEPTEVVDVQPVRSPSGFLALLVSPQADLLKLMAQGRAGLQLGDGGARHADPGDQRRSHAGILRERRRLPLRDPAEASDELTRRLLDGPDLLGGHVRASVAALGKEQLEMRGLQLRQAHGDIERGLEGLGSFQAFAKVTQRLRRHFGDEIV